METLIKKKAGRPKKNEQKKEGEQKIMSNEKRFCIKESFTYRGPDGKWKPDQFVVIGPGEPLPLKIQSSELKRLMSEDKICEIDADGNRISNKMLIELTHEQVERTFSGKNEIAIVAIINGNNFAKETLGRVLVFCEKNQLKQASILIEQKLMSS